MTEAIPWRTDDELAADDAEEERWDDAREHRRRVESSLERLRAEDEARRIMRQEARADVARPRLVRLDEFLARPNEDPQYRIADVWPTGGRVVLAAQFKAGKTTLVANALRALADGDDFLERFTVSPGARIALIDDELDDRTLQSWLHDQRIQNQQAVSLVPLRGLLTTFDIRDPDVRAEWAADIAGTGADIVVLDCLRPLLDALGLDENREAGQFLVAFDALLAESGATEALVVHHMGHQAERSRGDSRINDWPDAIWKLVRDKDDDDPTIDNPAGSRYFSAHGRDVNVPQAELEHDPNTRHLTLGAAARTRKQATEHRRIVKAEEAVLAVIGAAPGINKTGIREAARTHGITHNPEIDQAVQSLITRGLINRQIAGKSHMHYLADSRSMPTMPNDAPGTMGAHVPNALIGHGHIDTTPETNAQPPEVGHHHEDDQ